MLTGKDQRVLTYLLEMQRKHPQGRPPSLRAISEACNLGEAGSAGSAAAAQYHLKKMVEMGLVEITEDTARKYRAIDAKAELNQLQRAADRYRPEQIFTLEALHAWAKRAGLTMAGAFAQEKAVLG